MPRPKTMMNPRHRLALIAALPVFLASADARGSIGFDSDDFLVADNEANTIAVYDSDFTYKGVFANFLEVFGLDFDASGNVVAVGDNAVAVYDRSGAQIGGFTNPDIFVTPIDIKVGPAALGGNYYVGTQLTARPGPFRGLLEISPAGDTLRQISGENVTGVAVLPGDVVWGGVFAPNGVIEEHDLATGAKTATIGFDNGQEQATAMFYSAATDTVLMGDFSTGTIFERSTDGSFIRAFTHPDLSRPLGVTRGPGGDVFATGRFNSGVYRWRADGTFVGFFDVSDVLLRPNNILWAGNLTAIPEPTSLIIWSLLGLVVVRRNPRKP